MICQASAPRIISPSIIMDNAEISTFIRRLVSLITCIDDMWHLYVIFLSTYILEVTLFYIPFSVLPG